MWVDMSIGFNFTGGKYAYTSADALQEGRGITSSIVNGFKHLKRFCNPNTTTWIIYPDITGDLPQALAQSIAHSLRQPKTVESLMANCQFVFQRGTELRDSGLVYLGTLWHFFAINLYQAAFKAYLKEDRPIEYGPDIFNITEQIGMTARMISGRGDETKPMLRDYELDVYAKRVLSAAIAFSNEYYVEGVPPRLLGRLHARLGQVFIDLGEPSRAYRHFDQALDYLPQDTKILARVRVFERLAHKQREEAILGFREFWSQQEDSSQTSTE